MDHDHHHHGGHHDGHDDEAVLAEMLDLDAEVLEAYLAAAIERVHELTGDGQVKRILDLGAGTGTGAIALVRRFPDAELIAVDQSPGMLGRLQAKIESLGLADRIRPVEANLDEAWPALEPVDLAWSSMALHHLADPSQGLAGIFAVVRPGGLLAVAELTSSLRFLPDDIGLGRPGLEARCDAAFEHERRADLPWLGADWGPLLAGAGFTEVTGQVFDIDLSSPLPPAAARYARGWLRRTRARLDGLLAADDLATLDVLTADDGPHSILERGDLAIRGSRTLWTGTRP
ncbi:MAG TPA: class I SAM-dependent methyltransferase [Streptosporangiaceae bacterium]|jgi:SAM-dependent methyltransferase|nr:class I SAM-dependent methyltransferase [Streptosporangiaceae bacterium]